jgi:hypothetical protein
VLGCSGGDSASAEGDESSGATNPGGAGSTASSGGAGSQTAGSEDAGCAAPEGVYEASYTEQSGTCGALDAPARVPLDSGSSGVQTTLERFATSTVTTETVLMGCSLRVTQMVTGAANAPRLWIDARALSIGQDGVIRGTAEVTRYDDGGQVECTGVYAVELRAAQGVIGTAGVGGEPSTTDPPLPADVQAAIQNDCAQTVQCAAQRDEPLPPNALDDCIAATTRQLSDDPARLTDFLARVERCASFVVCQYVDCALVPGS